MSIAEELVLADIPKDENGRYRSARLPSLRTAPYLLDPCLERPSCADEWLRRINDPRTLITLDLFCGAGGMSLGFEDAGFFVAAGIDAEPMAIATHSYNFLSKGVVENIREIKDPKLLLQQLGLPRVDVIIGGPPCQGFARIGKGKIRSIADLEKHYTEVINTLYAEFIRFVEILNPLAFVMENVPEMGRYENGALIQRIKSALKSYHIDAAVLDAVEFGVPQRRQRLFVQGNRLGHKIRWPKPVFGQKYVTVRQAISDLPNRTPPSFDEVLPYNINQELSTYQQLMRKGLSSDNEQFVFGHIIRQVRDDDKFIFTKLKEGQKYRDLEPEWQRYRTDIFDDKYWKLVYDNPSWTVTAHIRKDAYRYIHPQYCRTLSLREFARLQSFPDRFLFAGHRTERLRQVGNAVPPLLARAIAKQLHWDLSTHRTKELNREERERRWNKQCGE